MSLEKAKRREPRSRSIREALAIAYFRLGRWEEAEVELRALVDLSGGRVGPPRPREGTREPGPPRGDRALQACALAPAARQLAPLSAERDEPDFADARDSVEAEPDRRLAERRHAGLARRVVDRRGRRALGVRISPVSGRASKTAAQPRCPDPPQESQPRPLASKRLPDSRRDA